VRERQARPCWDLGAAFADGSWLPGLEPLSSSRGLKVSRTVHLATITQLDLPMDNYIVCENYSRLLDSLWTLVALLNQTFIFIKWAVVHYSRLPFFCTELPVDTC